MNYPFLVTIAVLSYALGSVPFSNIVAHIAADIDLREVGTGTVTPRNLYDHAGLRPAVIAVLLELGKGVAGPLLAGRGNLIVTAIIGAVAVVGHNWSIFLGGRGGRGVSTATGVFFVLAWPAAAVMCAGLLAGVLAKRVGPTISVALGALLPVLVLTSGIVAFYGALIVLSPIAIKTALLIRKRGVNVRSKNSEVPDAASAKF